MPTGTVKWFSTEKGFGFIKPDDGSKDVFVDQAEVERAKIDRLKDGASCSYEVVVRNDGRLCAADLKLL